MSPPSRGIRPQGLCHPSRSERLLLKAAIGRGEEALDAWREWSEEASLRDLGEGCYKLLPLVYRNLTSLGADDPDRARLKGVYRHTWARNQQLLSRGKQVLTFLESDDIPTMVLKGVCLNEVVYRDCGLRPMADFDVLIPTEHARAACEILTSHGWRSHLSTPLTPSRLSIQNGTAFTHPSGSVVDLHWHMLHDNCSPHADEDYWLAAQPHHLLGVPTRTLCPTDLLFHVCVHGARWNQVAPIRWVADAVLLLRSHLTAIDWSRLVGLAKQHRHRPALLDTLSFLVSEYQMTVPDTVLSALTEPPLRPEECWDYRVGMQSTYPLLNKPAFFWRLYKRSRRPTSIVTSLAGFPNFLRDAYGVSSLAQLPSHIAGRLIRRQKNAGLHRPDPAAEQRPTLICK